MILETPRILIRRFTAEDIDLIYEINNHPECIRFNGFDSMSYERCQEVLKGWMDKYAEEENVGVLCAESRENGTKIGMAFIVKTKLAGEYGIGFRLRRTEWDKGYAKEITKGFIEYGANVLKGSAVVAEVYKANERSRNVFQKLGFIEKQHPEGEDGLVYVYNIK